VRQKPSVGQQLHQAVTFGLEKRSFDDMLRSKAGHRKFFWSTIPENSSRYLKHRKLMES
jgi:hypothetical protein